MDGLLNGIYELVTWGQKIGAALTVLALVVLGLGTITGGAEGKMTFKEVMKSILIGCAICFGASSLGKMFFDWFS